VHPGTGAFDNPAEYETSRPLFRLYEPLITWLDEAGWQPVTLAVADPPTVLVERYGPGPGDLSRVVFGAVRNPGQSPRTASLQFQHEALPRPLRDEAAVPVAWLLVADRPAKLTRSAVGNWRVTGISLDADATEVVVLGTRADVGRLWVAQAVRWLDRLAQEAKWLEQTKSTVVVNGDFERGLDSWGTERPPAARSGELAIEEQQPISGKRSLRATSQAPDAYQALHRDLSLDGGAEYALRFRYRWDRPAGATGTVTPRFGVRGPDGQWAADRYLYFRDLQPTAGKVADCERRFTVRPGDTTGFFQILFEGNWGVCQVDDISVEAVVPPNPAGRYGDLSAAAAAARQGLGQGLAAAAVSDLLGRTAAVARPAFLRLQELAGAVTDPHARRCLTLPAEDFADCIGRAATVLADVDVRFPANPPFADGALGATVPLNWTVRAGSTALSALRVGTAGQPADLAAGAEARGAEPVPLPAEKGFGWADTLVQATATCDGVRLRVRSWLPAETPVSLTAELDPGDGKLQCGPAPVRLAPGQSAEFTLSCPGLSPDRAEALALAGASVKLSWTARVAGQPDLTGQADLPVVRGARLPALAAPPAIDGTVNSAEWAGAGKLTGFVVANGAKAAPRSTTVLSGHAGGDLCLAFICQGQPNPQAAPRARDAAVWEDDAVEVFVQPPGSEAYFHLAVSAAGVQYDARCQGGIDADWNGKWAAKAGRVADGWTVELRLPLATLAATAGGVWRANFGREENDTGAASCWSPVSAGFHGPSRFGVLTWR
jgi:hypothetical protein